MELSRYRKVGNSFFENKLRDYRELGITYNEYWKKAYDAYIHAQMGGSDQGLAHTKDVEHNIWLLIEQYIRYFPKEVLYILSVAAAVHDCAKTAKSSDDHAIKGAELIRNTFVAQGWFPLQETADAIANIVHAHQSGDFSVFKEDVIRLNGHPIRIKDCAAIFRLADMMSTTEERGVRAHTLLGLAAPTLNTFVNSVRLDIRSCVPSKKNRAEIEVTACSDEIRRREHIENYIRGLNGDITEEHKRLLENAKVSHVTQNYAVREKEIILPYKFVLTKNPSFLDTLREKIPVTFNIQEAGRLVPCYFHNRETDIDIYTQFMDSIEKDNVINSKFLYWTLRGTKEYLSLCKDPGYQLGQIAHNLLKEKFGEIYQIINSDRSLLQIVDLGVGDGQEINIILDAFISDSNKNDRIYCSLVDSSYHMLRVAINFLDEVNLLRSSYKEKVDLFAINCDFRDVHLYKETLKKGARLFCLLGGTLGNFTESELIDTISKGMDERDFLLLGVDLIGNRTDEEIISSYDNLKDKKFIFSPLAEIGFVFEEASFTFEIKKDISEVAGAKTIIAKCSVEDKNIQMGKSTKYVLTNLESYLQRYDFDSINEFTNMDYNYALLLIKKRSH